MDNKKPPQYISLSHIRPGEQNVYTMGIIQEYGSPFVVDNKVVQRIKIVDFTVNLNQEHPVVEGQKSFLVTFFTSFKAFLPDIHRLGDILVLQNCRSKLQNDKTELLLTLKKGYKDSWELYQGYPHLQIEKLNKYFDNVDIKRAGAGESSEGSVNEATYKDKIKIIREHLLTQVKEKPKDQTL